MANEWSEAAATELRAQMGRERANSHAVAKESGLSPSSVSRKLKGERAIDLDEFASMSAALNVQPSEMFRRVVALIDHAA